MQSSFPTIVSQHMAHECGGVPLIMHEYSTYCFDYVSRLLFIAQSLYEKEDNCARSVAHTYLIFDRESKLKSTFSNIIGTRIDTVSVFIVHAYTSVDRDVTYTHSFLGQMQRMEELCVFYSCGISQPIPSTRRH